MRLASALLTAFALALTLPACAETPPPPATVPVAPAPPGPSAEAAPPSAPRPAPPKSTAAARPTGVPGTSIHFTGGDGSSMEQAIVIEGAQGEVDGVRSEYQYLEMVLGPRSNWTRTKQSLVDKNGRKYDVLEVDHQGRPETYWFDITLYFGKM
ncbi:Hypothetical protein A7982_01472 [Minicystis rosea]|nr:Hypothetical protein A7982_01472 [Minicystis rosea]